MIGSIHGLELQAMTSLANVRLAILACAAGILAGCSAVPAAPDSAAIPSGPEPDPYSATSSDAIAPPPGWRTIGLSVRNRPILVAEAGHGPLRILLVGGIHGDETEGRAALEALKQQRNADATIRIVRDLNPDGTAAGRRTNARGYDLNRNWPATNFNPGTSGGPAPLSEPETRVLDDQLRAFRPDIVVVLHSIADGPFVNFDGPAEKLAAAFVPAARASDPSWRVEREMGYETPGSLGSYLGVDRGLPILTVEFRRGQDDASARASLEQGLSAIIRTALPTSSKK